MRHSTGGQGGGRGQGGVNGHHLRVHGEAGVGVMATAAIARESLDGLKLGLGLGRVSILMTLVWLGPATVVKGEDSFGQGAGLEDAAAVIAGAIVIEALADDLATLDDDTTVAVVQGREVGLLDAEVEVRIGLHF